MIKRLTESMMTSSDEAYNHLEVAYDICKRDGLLADEDLETLNELMGRIEDNSEEY